MMNTRIAVEPGLRKIILIELLFPMVLCIIPALLLVLLGPAFIQISRILLPTLGGQ